MKNPRNHHRPETAEELTDRFLSKLKKMPSGCWDLFLGTPKQNSEHMVASGRAATGLRNGKYTKPERTPRGDRHGTHTHPEVYREIGRSQRKLTKVKCERIQKLYAKGYSQDSLALRFGVSQRLISLVVRNEYAALKATA